MGIWSLINFPGHKAFRLDRDEVVSPDGRNKQWSIDVPTLTLTVGVITTVLTVLITPPPPKPPPRNCLLLVVLYCTSTSTVLVSQFPELTL